MAILKLTDILKEVDLHNYGVSFNLSRVLYQGTGGLQKGIQDYMALSVPKIQQSSLLRIG